MYPNPASFRIWIHCDQSTDACLYPLTCCTLLPLSSCTLKLEDDFSSRVAQSMMERMTIWPLVELDQEKPKGGSGDAYVVMNSYNDMYTNRREITRD